MQCSYKLGAKHDNQECIKLNLDDEKVATMVAALMVKLEYHMEKIVGVKSEHLDHWVGMGQTEKGRGIKTIFMKMGRPVLRSLI